MIVERQRIIELVVVGHGALVGLHGAVFGRQRLGRILFGILTGPLGRIRGIVERQARIGSHEHKLVHDARPVCRATAVAVSIPPVDDWHRGNQIGLRLLLLLLPMMMMTGNGDSNLLLVFPLRGEKVNRFFGAKLELGRPLCAAGLRSQSCGRQCGLLFQGLR